ncbi:hypothetical protein BGZ49_000608 [Haplosporangium sp. Z 27]|nr:hypothetical protein BGZ49_000608 [Haplosporangium sp. Z 27]
MGTFSGVSMHNASSSSGPTSLPQRSSLKPPSQVRWPVNLNQLAAISLEDDSDLDRSFTDASKEIGSVRLLRLLKDSDDESTPAIVSSSRLRRPKSTYASLQAGQQQQKLLQKAGIPVSRSSSMHGTNGSQSGNTGIPKPPQRSGTDIKGSNSSTEGTTIPRLRHYQSESLLMSSKRREKSEDTENSVSGVNSIPQTSSNASSRVTDPTGSGVSGIRGPSSKNGTSPNSTSMLRRPTGNQSTSATPSSIPAGAQLQSKSKTSTPKTLTSSSSSSSLKQRESLQAVAGSKYDSQLSESPKDTASPTRIPGSPGYIQSTSAARKLASLQQSPLARSSESKIDNTDGQLASSLLPLHPTSGAGIDTDSEKTIRELNEELERWKTEVSEYRQERVAAETFRKQISTLERDLGIALDTLATAEAKVAETKSERDSVEKTIESLKKDLEATTSQIQQLEKLESTNKELEKKLEEAQHEIDQLELQVVPAELQDVHQSLFSVTQELEEAKKNNEQLRNELSEEKAKVAREQEDSGQLLVKLSQLQDTIANHIQDNNALKDMLKEHEKCQENAENVDQQHKIELERLQNEILVHQQSAAQENDQKARLEQALQEQQYHAHQFQQQVQLQQTQLIQQQTEIVNLRAALEVEQKQAALLQQRLQEEQRLKNQFGRRVSTDGELNGSFMMVESSNGGISPGSVPTSMPVGNPDSIMGTFGGVHPFASVGSNAMSTMTSGNLTSSSIQSIRNFDASSPTVLTNQTSALPPAPNVISSGGMVGPSGATGTNDIDSKPKMTHRGSSSSATGILISGGTNSNRLSLQADSSVSNGGPNSNQTVEELTAQLHHLMKEKERLQADLSKIPISGGGPMTRRKAEMLEEQMDQTEQSIGKLRYSIRMRS